MLRNYENLRNLRELVVSSCHFHQEMASSSNKKLPQPEEGSSLEAQTSPGFSQVFMVLKFIRTSRTWENMEKHGKAWKRLPVLQKFFIFV